ncbi:MAG: hypothetical protein NTX28_08510 [Novosphingobium sp.]|nr:hypothetical protein [Novosphingobium sp.]
MPEISALSLQAALTPSAAPAAAAPLENAGNPAEPGTAAPAPSFDALLALQAATQGSAPAPASDLALARDATAMILPDSGKTLPDAANPVAAPAPAGLQQAMAMQATSRLSGPGRNSPDRTGPDRTGPDRTGPDRTGPDRTGKDEPSVATQADAPAEESRLPASDAQVLPQPDIALFAAIFAAPDRLANAPAQPRGAPSQAKAQPQAGTAATLTPATAPTAQATPGAVAAAIASTAQIEVVAPAAPVDFGTSQELAETPATAPVAPSAGPSGRPAPFVLGMQPAKEAITGAPAVPAANLAADLETRMPGPADGSVSGADPLASAIAIDGPLQAEAQPSAGPARAEARGEARAERIDFATLVDTLNRAREDASPRTLNVAVTNTDFGRVSMRFDSSDAGLSVAMSAADPGFARAITASSESAATSPDTRGQNAQNGQNPADASAARQQPGQNPQHQQQTATARGDGRPSANAAPNAGGGNDAGPATASATAPGGDSSIYA